MSIQYLSGAHKRGSFLRYDTAVILKRFYLVERQLVISQAGWIPGLPSFEAKTLLPHMLWQDAQNANSLRERVFELRFPNRMLEIGDDQVLIDLVRHSCAAPNGYAFLSAMATVWKPALLAVYREYLELADEIGDGPTYRFLQLAAREKEEQIGHLKQLLPTCEEPDEAGKRLAEAWLADLAKKFAEAGGLSLDRPVPVQLAAEAAFAPAEVARRGGEFQHVRFYWPDIVDAAFPYGEGLQLQLRSAVSHFNEVWAVENAGFLIYALAEQLEWEFMVDASRWIYDESRHCRMGYERLKSWGFEDHELPLGTYIYDSCQGQDLLYRLGMLFHFESKNIGKKIERIKSFGQMNDRLSQHDMDFDWADETIHTSYGTKWLAKLLAHRKQETSASDFFDIKHVCEQLVDKQVQTATEAEVAAIKRIASHMLSKVSG